MVDIIDPREHLIITSKGVIKKVVHDITFKDRRLTGNIVIDNIKHKVYQRRSLWHLEE